MEQVIATLTTQLTEKFAALAAAPKDEVLRAEVISLANNLGLLKLEAAQAELAALAAIPRL